MPFPCDIKMSKLEAVTDANCHPDMAMGPVLCSLVEGLTKSETESVRFI